MVTTREIYKKTQAVCAKRLNVEDDMLNDFNFPQHYFLHIVVSTEVVYMTIGTLLVFSYIFLLKSPQTAEWRLERNHFCGAYCS